MEYTNRLKFYLYVSSKFTKDEADIVFRKIASIREEIIKEKKTIRKHFTMSHLQSDLK